MKPNKTLFIVSLVIVVLLSLADNRFFAFGKAYNFSSVTRQVAHFSIFFTTAAIGYFNWKNGEKWLIWLWMIIYGAALLFIITLAISIHFLAGHHNAQKWINVMADVRTIFTGPVPLMVFWLLQNITKKLVAASTPVSNGKE